jgi:hypothetical protein
MGIASRYGLRPTEILGFLSFLVGSEGVVICSALLGIAVIAPEP